MYGPVPYTDIITIIRAMLQYADQNGYPLRECRMWLEGRCVQRIRPNAFRHRDDPPRCDSHPRTTRGLLGDESPVSLLHPPALLLLRLGRSLLRLRCIHSSTKANHPIPSVWHLRHVRR